MMANLKAIYFFYLFFSKRITFEFEKKKLNDQTEKFSNN